MRKIRTILFYASILIFCYSCEKENIDGKNSIVIETEKNDYNINNVITISITNNLNENATHFICDNHGLRASHLLKYESEKWIEEEITYGCYQMGPMGFFGTISMSETKIDSISIDNAGLYKLKYTFIIDSDTAYYYSNNFQVND